MQTSRSSPEVAMDKGLWRRVLENGAAVPKGHTAAELLPDLLAGLGSTDPELRDSLCNEVLYHWIIAGQFTADELWQMAERLLTNLQDGVGHGENDRVFLRSFATLALRYILLYDAAERVLDPGQVGRILDASLLYLAAEGDWRGFVPGKGWAHSVAHTADLLLALAEHPQVGAADLERILWAIADKVLAHTRYPFIAHEGFRLSRTVLGVLRRDLVPADHVGAWLEQLGAVPQRETFMPGRDDVRYHNAEAFLSALDLTLRHHASAGGDWAGWLAAVDAARLPYTPL